MAKRRRGQAIDEATLLAYLPPRVRRRIALVPRAERGWRLRLVLLLWSLGYQLDFAAILVLDDVRQAEESFREQIERLTDERLVAALDATAVERADGRTSFASPIWPASPSGQVRCEAHAAMNH